MSRTYDTGRKVKFFDQLYVGRKTQDEDSVPLGFMTPFENNKAGAKRRESVDDWARRTNPKKDSDGHYIRTSGNGYWVQYDKLDAILIDNVPIAGFKMADMVRRYETKNVLWRIIDPRGFELELSSDNLHYLINEHGISKGGVIDGECVWARVGAQNFLIPKDTLYFADYEV